jgi:hypothetical protein
MTRALFIACLVAAGTGGCDALPSEFLCHSADACRQGGTQGTCEPDGHCSFPDETCASKRRYADFSGRLSAVCVGTDAPQPGTVQLTATWFGQERLEWSAPASAQIALSTLVAAPPSQQDLATYMGTTVNGTDNVGLVQGALNHFANTTWFETKFIPNCPPTDAQRELLKRDVLLNVNTGHPLVANVISGFRPPGYPPTGTIYHYVAVVGYASNGDMVLIADPGAEGHGGADWQNVMRFYWISTIDLGTWICNKGYTA